MGNCNWTSIICHFVNLSQVLPIAKQSDLLRLLILVIQPIACESNLDVVFQKFDSNWLFFKQEMCFKHICWNQTITLIGKWKLLNGIGQTDRETVNKFENLAKALFQAW